MLKKKRKMSFSEILASEREQIRKDPHLMDEIEQKLDERLSAGVMEAAEK